MKILILKPSSLGDVVQALPVLRSLKRHLPGSRIYWWIETGLAPLLEDDPDLAGLVLFHRRRWASPLNWGELWRSVLWVRAQRFDWVIDLQGLARSASFAWLANGRLTVGLDDHRELARGFYDLIVRRPSFLTHAADWYLEVLRHLRVPIAKDVEWLRPRPEIAGALREKCPANGDRWIVVQPGARWPNKRYPIDSFGQVLRQLAARDPRLRFAILGSREEQPLGLALTKEVVSRSLDLTGRTSLPEMVEWIRRCDLMISNDTGPMHIAAALHKPLVAIFGPTEPRRTGPYGQLDSVLQLDLPCSPCLKSRCHYFKRLECLRALAPDLIVQAALNHLGSPP
ncbi:MAG TPA: glycosyltransferase family 9 protein [Verrucomicrobiae bacterium]